METSHANQVELRNLQMEDYDQLARSFKRIYADSDVFWTHAQIKSSSPFSLRDRWLLSLATR